MEALWNLEDKWKVSSQRALILLVCTTFGVIGLCMATTILRLKWKSKRKQMVINQEANDTIDTSKVTKYSQLNCGWKSITKSLINSMRRNKPNKWEEIKFKSWRETPLPLLDNGSELDMSWQNQSHNSNSSLWKKPILMGEKCELPRFSGLILYDEQGYPLCGTPKETSSRDGQKMVKDKC